MNLTVVIFSFLWTAALVLVALTHNPAWLLLPFAVFLVHEIVFFGTGVSLLFRSNDLTENFYDLSLWGKYFGSTADDNYSEGYYGEVGQENYDVTPRVAENHKFARFLDLLGAEQGDTILNMGCGTCTFDAYCKTRGIKTIGITLSAEQVALCKSKGVEAIQWNYNEFNPALEGVADHVMANGTFEHVNQNGGPPSWRSSYQQKVHDATAILSIYKRYLRKDDGRKHRIMVSTLHQNERATHDWGIVLLQRSYGGLMFLDTPELDVRMAAKGAGLRTTVWEDHTRDYYMSTILDKNHFGRPASFTHPAALAMMVGGVAYPYIWYMWLYYVLGVWMYMFDGKFHVVGINAENADFGCLPINETPNSLKWAVLENEENIT